MSTLKINPKEPEWNKPDVSLNDIMELLQKQWEEIQSLRTENQELSQKMDPWYEIRMRRERYEWPRKFSYRMLEGKPIVNLKTTSNTMYQNPYTKKWEADQKVEVEFYDWEKKVYDYFVFWNLNVQSEKMFAKEETKRNWILYFKFEFEWKEFEVPENIIN